MAALALLLICLLSVCTGIPSYMFTDHVLPPETLPSNVIADVFTNKVDHFNLASTETFKQQYWHIDDHWDQENGPAILYVQGENPGIIVGSRTVPLELAQALKARLYALEHRFYGVSQPCKDWSLECLRFLSHHQAMADMANFIETKTKEMGNPKRKWLIIGGSYAGALVVWFKSKYPHLAHVVYSASGVVNVVSDFTSYMEQINTDLSKDPKCYSVIVDINTFAVNVITRGNPEEKHKLKASMNAGMLDDNTFLLYISDMYVGEIQYSSRKAACAKIIKLQEEKSIHKRIVLYGQLGASFGVTPDQYTLEKERNINIDPTSSSRQWMYQVCTAYGWFQSGESNSPVRTPLINLDYWKKTCKTMFGPDIFPDERYSNGILGDLRIPPIMSNLIMTNGGDDPWHLVSFRDEKISRDDLLIMIIKCDDCGHCIDLYKTNEGDSKILIDARQTIKQRIMKWMSQPGELDADSITNAEQ